MSARADSSSLPGHPDYQRLAFPPDPERRVYFKGDGKPLILMHELPGLAEPCVQLADDLVEEGFAVYMPLLFGEPMKEAWRRNYVRLCISREFVVLRKGITSPATRWIAELVRTVSKRHGGTRVGVIGMCLSGGFVIPLIMDDAVGAAVCSQPGLPLIPLLGGDFDLGVSAEDLTAAAKRAKKDGVCLLGFRFTADRRSPARRFEHLRDSFGGQFDCYEIPTPDPTHNLDEKAHSVLTYEYKGGAVPDDHPTRTARKLLLNFLKGNL